MVHKPQKKRPELAAVELAPGDLVANPRNPRLHPDAQIEKLAASLRRFGQPRPIIARLANHMIIAGHGIHAAAVRAGLPAVKAVLWDVDQRTADAYMLADNKLPEGARDQPERIAELLRELREQEDLDALGFEAAEVNALLAEDAELEVAEVQTGPVRDTFWISITGPLAEQAHMLQALKKAAEGRPGVEVELGTTAID